MDEIKKKDGRGGWRGGIKPRKYRKRCIFGIDADVLEILSKVGNRSDYVNKAVRYFAAKDK